MVENASDLLDLLADVDLAGGNVDVLPAKAVDFTWRSPYNKSRAKAA